MSEITEPVEILGIFGESVWVEARPGYVIVDVDEGDSAADARLSIAAATRLRDALTAALVVASAAVPEGADA